MADSIEDFFPVVAEDTWKFLEKNSGATLVVKYHAKAHGGRRSIELELSGLPPHVNPVFFDRLTLNGSGLELNRIKLTRRAIDINPPLVITINPSEPNQVAQLFPPDALTAFNDMPPFAGKVTSKKTVLLDGAIKQFEASIVSTAQHGEKVFRATMQFQTGRGLTDYRGDMGGVFFVYVRQP